MDQEAREKWNRIYAEQPAGGNAATVLVENRHLLPSAGKSLEIAAGLGANALLLARHGLDTEAWDISDDAVAKLNALADEEKLPLRARQCDITQSKLPTDSYDVMVVAHYLERGLCGDMMAALKPGGLIFYQTFTRTVTADYSGPRNPDFRLADNELLALFAGLRIVFYREEGLAGDVRQGKRNLAMLVAQKTR